MHTSDLADMSFVFQVLPAHPELVCVACSCTRETGQCSPCTEPVDRVLLTQGVSTLRSPLCAGHFREAVGFIARCFDGFSEAA